MWPWTQIKALAVSIKLLQRSVDQLVEAGNAQITLNTNTVRAIATRDEQIARLEKRLAVLEEKRAQGDLEEATGKAQPKGRASRLAKLRREAESA